MDLIEELKQAVPMEVRSASRGTEYLEAVISIQELAPVETILTRHLGEPHKGPGQTFLFDAEMKRVIDTVGGLMIEQTLYYRKAGGTILYAMLWPWQSDPSKITLKAGVVTGA